jgi:hypothetical protein
MIRKRLDLGAECGTRAGGGRPDPAGRRLVIARLLQLS